METPERLYTLREARLVIAEQECNAHGHDWNVVQSVGVGPTHIICERCGASRKVQQS